VLEKNKRGIRLSPAFTMFQLIAPLPLDECVYRIRFGFQMELLSIEVKQLDADRVNFQIKKQFGERVLQGTLYYINAETTGIRANAPIELRIFPNLFAPLGILVFLLGTPIGFNGMIGGGYSYR
jgi:hypothetical protein